MPLSVLFTDSRLRRLAALCGVIAVLLGWTPCGATPEAGGVTERWKASFTVHYSTPASESVVSSLATVGARLEVLEQAEKALRGDALMRLLAQDTVNGAYRRMALVATAYPVHSTLQRAQGAITGVAVIRTSAHSTEALLREALRKTDSLDAWAAVLARYTGLIKEGMRLLEQENREEKLLYAASVRPGSPVPAVSADHTALPDHAASPDPKKTSGFPDGNVATTSDRPCQKNAGQPEPVASSLDRSKDPSAPLPSATAVDTPFAGTFDSPSGVPPALAAPAVNSKATGIESGAESGEAQPLPDNPPSPNQATPVQSALYNTLAQLQALADQLQALDEYCSALRYFDGTWPDPEAALEAMDRALALEPDNTLFLLGRAEALIQLDRVYEGLEALNTAARLDDFPARGYYARGVAQLRLHMPSLAIHDLSKAIALRPDKAAWWHTRGAAKLLSGEYDTLCEDLYQACALGDCQGLANVRLRNLCQ